jgi:hypothetical protein
MDHKLFDIKNCEFCGVVIQLKIVKTGPRKGLLRVGSEKRRYCSKKCQINWQKTISWEDRIGRDRAAELRKTMSDRFSGKNNPSCDPMVSSKISNSLKMYLKDNPRIGEKNPFFGKEHTDEYKQWASDSRKGKRSYDDTGFLKQNQNTPKLQYHHNWQGGLSFGEYDVGFNKQKKYLIKVRDNLQCQLCNRFEITSKLHIHHIDYNKQNSDEKNLIVLCNSCHSKTNWNRESWIQFFKPIIEKKYIN